jgi:hypothetical protein
MTSLRIAQNFSTDFVLDSSSQEALGLLLTSDGFLGQVAGQLECQKVEFTGMLFQPMPYSIATPKGMPPEFEPYLESEEHAVINVPPSFMFKAKISSPSRLCAIYKKV